MAGLEGLARALAVEALELRAERARALASRTLTGHARNALGYALSLYCLLRCGPADVCRLQKPFMRMGGNLHNGRIDMLHVPHSSCCKSRLSIVWSRLSRNFLLLSMLDCARVGTALDFAL